jgi:hypothetical protein
MVRSLVLLVTVASCALAPCVRRLDRWCEGSLQQEREPVSECPTLSDEGSVSCGNEYDVIATSGGFSGEAHYFRDGEHVATAFFTDTNTHCGGFVFWYGRKVDCPAFDLLSRSASPSRSWVSGERFGLEARCG